MVRCDAVVVGGGPAGSTCARALVQAGWRVVVLDRARFPRDKVCAGWVTPGVFRLLDLDPAEYAATGLTIQPIRAFKTSVIGPGRPQVGPLRQIESRYPDVISYAIRRLEFDHYLLQRSGAHTDLGTPLRTLNRRGGMWRINDQYEAPVLIGAGGYFCPVSAYLVKGVGSHISRTPPVLAREAEFRLAGTTTVGADAPELFFCRDLEGYGWCVRKGDFLNIGIGRRDSNDFNAHVRHFIGFLQETGRATAAGDVQWRGHAYLAMGAGQRPVADDGVMLAGDAAGLAYPESGEGIKPAVESGRLAAETLIAASGRTDRAALASYDRAIRRRYPPASRTPKALAPAAQAIGRALLGSRAFTRRVVIDRWFLRNLES